MRGIWLLLVCRFSPLIENTKIDTHAIGIYGTSLMVCVMERLVIGTPTGRIYTYPQHQLLQCPKIDYGSFKTAQNKASATHSKM